MANNVESATPFSESRLKEIAEESCEKAFGTATQYDHTQTESWNGSIINNILTALTSTPADSQPTQQQYKYAVTSTIIQHLSSEPTTSTVSTSTGTNTDGPSEGSGTNGDSGLAASGIKPQAGRRGMHSATGAYWNSETDGMWSFKWEQGEKRGCDVVISVLWIEAFN